MPRKIANRFIAGANGILQGRHGFGPLESLTLSFNLHGNHAIHLDIWVSLAVSSPVKELVFVLLPPRNRSPAYNFPYHFFSSERGGGSSVVSLVLGHCSLRPPSAVQNFGGFKNLRRLSLGRVEATDRVIHDLLSHTVALKWLSLEKCGGLVCLELPSSLSELEFLHVEDCWLLAVVDCRRASSLSMVRYWGGWPARTIRAPSPEEACIRTSCMWHPGCSIVHFLTGIPCDMPSLRTLRLDMDWTPQVRQP